jgi:hypothetical protein
VGWRTCRALRGIKEVLRIKDERQGLRWGRMEQVRVPDCLEESGGVGDLEAWFCSRPTVPSTEQRGTDPSLDPGPSPCLLSGARLLVCLHLPSSIKVSWDSGLCPVMLFRDARRGVLLWGCD